MDSGVSAVQAQELGVRLVLRAQSTDFPGEDADSLFARARSLASGFAGKGYREVSAAAVPIKDPSDKSRSLDTWYEVTYECTVKDESELYAELRFALGVVKVAARP
jgi:hypothetical protein